MQEFDNRQIQLLANDIPSSRFPQWRYQHGGIVKDKIVQDPSEWTGKLVLALVHYLRIMESRNMSFALLAHSAGGQFLSRLAAFVPCDATRMVIANPGTHVFPDLNVSAPYGMGGVYPEETAEVSLRGYLARPITIMVGDNDTRPQNDEPERMAQGATRYARGLNAFKAGESLADSRGWTFNWRLVVVPGVGHDGEKMLGYETGWDELRAA